MTIAPADTASQGGLAGAYAPLADQAAADLLRRHYGLEGPLVRFETEKDDTFQVSAQDGQRYVLKVSNPDEPWQEVDFQNAVLRHVAARDPDLPVPRIIPDRQGRDMFAETDGGAAGRIVRVLTFIDGTPLCETNSKPSQRIQIGRVLARLRLATADLTHPGAERQYPWDVQHLLLLEPLLEKVEDGGQRRVLSAGLERFRRVEPILRTCRQQVLHNDFSKSNIVVDPDSAEFVTGIIDFGDTVKTAIAVDVATACLNQLPQEPEDDAFARARDIIEGYLQIADLTETELRLIPHLTMGRVVARALITLWRATLFPRNERYIMRNTHQGWWQLDWFLDRSPDEVSELLVRFADQEGQLR